MAKLVDVLIEDDRWQGMDMEGLAQSTCENSLRFLKIDSARFEISLMGCNDARITELNREYRAKPKATNVLSWPSQELSARIPGDKPRKPDCSGGGVHGLGDIAIAYETCLREAKLAGKPQEQHVCHLLVHATLHLLGYDHIVTEDAELMENIERQVLAIMGYPDPYGDN